MRVARISTHATVRTNNIRALAGCVEAQVALVPSVALAGEAVGRNGCHQRTRVDAGTISATWKRVALVYIHFALTSCVSWRAEALVCSKAVDTLSTVHARIGVAFHVVVARKTIIT